MADRNGVAYFRLGIWKLEGLRKGIDKEKCPLCREEENHKGIHLKYTEKQRGRRKRLNGKCLSINEEIAYKKLMKCTKITDLGNLGNFLCQVNCER
jgi:hypothetical protein